MDKTTIHCPCCGSTTYWQMYSVATAMYSPILIKDGEPIVTDMNYYSDIYTCDACGAQFKATRHNGEISVDAI